MKVTCAQKDLQKALNIVSKAVKPNSTLPVLDNILIKTEGKKLFFLSTNLEIAIECSIEAQVKNEGSLTVPAKLLDSYVSLLKDDQVELSVNNGTDFHLKSKSSETKMKGIKSEDFPAIPKVEREGSFQIEGQELIQAVGQVVFAASSGTSRPVLAGVYFKLSGENLTLVATDSYRLAERKVKVSKSESAIEEIIIPSSTMSEVARIFEKSGDPIEVIISKNQVLFSQKNVQLTSRLVEGKFPDYTAIIPKQKTSSAILDMNEFLLAIKRVSLFARENSYNIRLEVLKEGKLLISSSATEMGEGKTEVTARVQGEDAAIALNAQFLIDFLGNLSESTVLFDIDTKLTPAVLRPEGKQEYLYLVMPLKLD